jgi:type IV pilus assembly protein PilX
MMTFVGSRPSRLARSRAQRGVALVVALILLVVATLLGLAASRGTIMQERMSANSYDRSLAFQRSEAALRAAESAITADWRIANLGGRDCSPDVATLCPVVPANAFSGTDAAWRNVPATFDINNANTPGIPQYQVQFMGTGRAANSLGTSENADTTNYGSGSPPDNVAFYRVTARSSDPAPGTLGERSIVVLQSTIKRPY